MRAVLAGVVKVIERLQVIGLWISSFMVGISVLLVTAETLNRPTNIIRVSFAEEMTGYALVFISLVAGSEAIRRGDFIRLYIFVKGLKEKIQLIGLALSYVIGLGMLTVFFLESLVMVKESLAYHAISATVFKTPLWVPQMFIVVGLAMMIIQVILKLVRSVVLSIRWEEIGEETKKRCWTIEESGNVDSLVK